MLVRFESIGQGHTRRYNLQMPAINMLISPSAASMLWLYLALFQLLIISNGMVSMRRPGIINHQPHTGAPVRALRVGIGEHAQHANRWANVPKPNALCALHAGSSGVNQHATGCHPLRNLFNSGPIAAGATVPLASFGALE